jgi:hypothetical protein
MQAQMEVGGWFERISGGLGVNGTFASGVRNLLSSQNINSMMSALDDNLKKAEEGRRRHLVSLFIDGYLRSALPLYLVTATAEDMQHLMNQGTLTSVELIRRCLVQVERRDGYLKVVLSTAPRALEQALIIDRERQAGNVRGPLHGIPVLVKVSLDPIRASSISVLTCPEQHRDGPRISHGYDRRELCVTRCQVPP